MTIPYEEWEQKAHQDVVKRSLRYLQEHKEFPGNHHFFFTFQVSYPGVEIPATLKIQYPQTMTIVLQHQFDDLRVFDDCFCVKLQFSKRWESLTIPFGALSSFWDPSVQFGYQFRVQPPAEESRPSLDENKSNVVSFQKFRSQKRSQSDGPEF